MSDWLKSYFKHCLLSWDACYTLGVLKPCYTVENFTNVPQKVNIHFLYQKMNGPEKKLSDNSTKCSITREQLQGSPLTKQDIIETYADIFTRIGKFPGLPYKFQLKPNAKPARHAPWKVPIHLQDAFHEEIRNLEALWILEETKDVTEWVKSFVIMEKKLPINSSNSHSPGHYEQETLAWILQTWMRPWRESLIIHIPLRKLWENFMEWQSLQLLTLKRILDGWIRSRIKKIHNDGLDIGRFQWMRLPMGSIVAQDVFQRKLDAIFLSVPGDTGIADDMIIYGKTDQEHNQHLMNFLDVCRKNTLTESRQDAVQTSTSFLLWTPMECKRS